MGEYFIQVNVDKKNISILMTLTMETNFVNICPVKAKCSVRCMHFQLQTGKDAESVYPLGNYSMVPVLSADDSAFKIALS